MLKFVSKLKHYLLRRKIKKAVKLAVKKIVKDKTAVSTLRSFFVHPSTIAQIRPYSEELAKELERNRMGAHLSVHMVGKKPVINVHIGMTTDDAIATGQKILKVAKKLFKR